MIFQHLDDELAQAIRRNNFKAVLQTAELITSEHLSLALLQSNEKIFRFLASNFEVTELSLPESLPALQEEDALKRIFWVAKEDSQLWSSATSIFHPSLNKDSTCLLQFGKACDTLGYQSTNMIIKLSQQENIYQGVLESTLDSRKAVEKLRYSRVADTSECNWHVYLLSCKNNSTYCGITTDFERRLEQHNSGTGSKSLRGRLPAEPLFVTTPTFSRAEALRLEACVKKIQPSKKAEFLQKANEVHTEFQTLLDLKETRATYPKYLRASAR